MNSLLISEVNELNIMCATDDIKRLIEPVTSQLGTYREPPVLGSEDVQKKVQKFVDCYHDDIECFDANSNKIIFPNKKVFQERYKTVFRESPDLDAIVSRRFLLSSSSQTTPTSIVESVFVVDCETFRNLVKPIGGSLDGSTGLSEKIKEAEIVVMYQVVPVESGLKINDKFLIRRAWFLANDDEGLGKKLTVQCMSEKSWQNNPFGGETMSNVSFDQVKTSKALTLFFGIAQKMVKSPENLKVLDLSPEYLQDCFRHT